MILKYPTRNDNDPASTIPWSILKQQKVHIHLWTFLFIKSIPFYLVILIFPLVIDPSPQKNGHLLNKINKMHFSSFLGQKVFSLPNLSKQIEQTECVKTKTLIIRILEGYKFKTRVISFQCISPWFTDGCPAAVSSHGLPFVYIHLRYHFGYKSFLSHKVTCHYTLAVPHFYHFTDLSSKLIA